MSAPFATVNEKLRRARVHLDELSKGIIEFLHETPSVALVDYDPQEAEAFRRFHQTRIVPLALSVTAGEVVYQIRSALDHLTCVFIQRHGGTLTYASQFPIWLYRPTKPDELRRYERQIAGIDPNSGVAALIEKCQPYHGLDRRETHALAILKSLSNTDKHRSLALHVVRVDPSIQVTVTDDDGEDIALPFDNEELGPELVPGKTLMGFPIVNVERNLTTDVAFAELSRGVQPLVLMRVKFIAAYVSRLVGKFQAEL